jgi:photosystem II stability/assembly factor-like uncharacterized protein
VRRHSSARPRVPRTSILVLIFLASVALAAGATKVDPKLLGDLEWRSIGPAMFAGRVVDVEGVPGNPSLMFYAHSSAGLFRSVNGGTTFESIFNDGNTLAVGAFALSPDNPDVIYVGTGEGCVRNSITYGDGIYKTVDGGRTWRHLGLKDTERFSKIVVNPKNPQIVLAAAMGHAFGPNEERGIFRTEDGGETWQKVLYTNTTSGASDVSFDPENPNIAYAGMYDYMRQPWFFRGGGPGSGLYRSADGGKTWKKLTDPALNNGLPGRQLIGRIGVQVSQSNPNVVYTLIESQEPGMLWRSDDRGINWTMVNENRNINNRPFYYTHLLVDPTNEHKVWAIAGSQTVSIDGGRTFNRPPGPGRMFGDHHALWIDPQDPNRMFAGSDGGFFVSYDGARNWDFKNNVPGAQAYHLGLDMAEPYNVLGGFQDHEIWRGPNEVWNQVGVREGDWTRLRYMADGMHTVPDPRNPDIVYFNGHFGDITWIDMKVQEERYIQPYPLGPAGGGADAELYRFNWDSPIEMSPTNPDVVYYGGNVLFKTSDAGHTWAAISPDLTTNNKEKQRSSGGEITGDNTRAEFHCTIVSISESPKDPNVIWAGTDDGNLQVTRDGGKTWTNVYGKLPGAPAEGWVGAVNASEHDAGTAYVSIDNHRLNDKNPYVYVTDDYGQTWRRISDGLDTYVRVVMPDLKERETWTDLRLGLPHVPVWDMELHPRDNDLVIATHARGFYVLDDATPLQELARAMATKMTLFKPMPPVRYTAASDTSVLGNGVWVAENQPYGAILSYYLAEPANRAELTILDANDRTVRTLRGGGKVGINRTVWNLTEAGCPTAGFGGGFGGGRGGGGGGPRVLPGRYKVRLTAAGQTQEQTFEVRMDPRIKNVTKTDLDAYWTEVQRLDRMDCSVLTSSNEIRSIESQLGDLEQAIEKAGLTNQAAAVTKGLSTASEELGVMGRRLNWLVRQVGLYTGRPTVAQGEWIGKLDAQLQQTLKNYQSILKGPLEELNSGLGKAKIPYIQPQAPSRRAGGFRGGPEQQNFDDDNFDF